jgi:hypothetical protein
VLTLIASGTIAGVASVASKVTCTLDYKEVNTSTGVETYKNTQLQLANSAATIYTATANGPTFVKSIHVVNTDAATTYTFQLFMGGTAAANAITPVWTLPIGGAAIYEDGLGWHLYNASGQLLTSLYATVSPLDNWGINGNKGETMDRNTCPEVNTTVATTGQIWLQAVWLTAGTAVNNISFHSATTAASVPTHYCFGLYDTNRNMLATTADQTSTAWGANTIKTLATTATYTVPTTGLYYLAFMVVATTVPTLKGGTARTGGQLATTTPQIGGISSTTYTTGTAPAGPLGSLTANPTISVWGCVS